MTDESRGEVWPTEVVFCGKVSVGITMSAMDSSSVFIRGAGSRLDLGLDNGNIRILPLAAYDFEEFRTLIVSWTLTFQEHIARKRKTPFNRCLTVSWGLLAPLVVWEISQSVIPEDSGVIRAYDPYERYVLKRHVDTFCLLIGT